MSWRICKKCKSEFFAEYKHCPNCGEEYKEDHRRVFGALAAVAVLLISAIVYQYNSIDLDAVENVEQNVIQKEEAAKLDEILNNKLPEVRRLEEEKVKIEERIDALSKKLSQVKQQHKRTLNLDGVMGHMSGENIPEQEAARIDDIVNESPEAKQLEEEKAKLAAVMNQLSEISQLYHKKTKSEERMNNFAEARRLSSGNLDASNEELVIIKNSLESFKTTEDEYQEAQKLLTFINDKIAIEAKKIKRKNQSLENERFEVETSSLSDAGKRLKKEHPNWGVEECDLVSKGKIKTGMLEEQVRAALGEPYTIKKTGARSKWLLRENSTACVYFEDGICVAVQQ